MNGEIRETQGGIMTEIGVDSQTERVISSEDAVSNQKPDPVCPSVFWIMSLK